MTCHIINKAAMKQNCIEVLNQHAQHAQPLENTIQYNTKFVKRHVADA